MAETEVLACPKCGKKGLVRCIHSEDDLFQCIYCDYRRDLTQSRESEGGPGTVFLAIASALLIALLLLG
ncbi:MULTISPECIES: hypothetical protein [Trichocoleus]|uniref:Replication restart DNA helicase PriA n=1 Tax=Trichocoleus desertorum GB2-A4 TaxID=2933944 RepID=A0ABV0J173_9CYAN|nr:hypothetical protein [Trichocoleus sp. FACHB-46]MBD1860136.1 hypothetical protein [Trichocoleus sp. FACHB-46]